MKTSSVNEKSCWQCMVKYERLQSLACNWVREDHNLNSYKSNMHMSYILYASLIKSWDTLTSRSGPLVGLARARRLPSSPRLPSHVERAPEAAQSTCLRKSSLRPIASFQKSFGINRVQTMGMGDGVFRRASELTEPKPWPWAPGRPPTAKHRCHLVEQPRPRGLLKLG